MLLRNALLPDHSEPVDIVIAEGRIAAIGADLTAAGPAWQAAGLTVLPGIVDLHGDAFERQVMPRPGVLFPLDLALLETDRQMVGNGITTAYHGLTWSWEPGLRSGDNAVRLVEAVEQLRPRLSCDTRIHLRHETYNLAAEATIIGWLEAGRIDLLAFNDHVPLYLEKLDSHGKLAGAAARAGLPVAEFADLVRAVHGRKPEVAPSIARLAEVARRHGVTMASHDDETPEMRRWFNDLGCTLCEFPITLETAAEALRCGDPVIMGAPNILRGGSHCDRLGAEALIRDGMCSVLTSDYYYPALAEAAFMLVRRGVADLAAAWRLISTGPAAAAGLDDRGVVAPGRRADLLLYDLADIDAPRLIATLVAGRPVHVADRLGQLAA